MLRVWVTSALLVAIAVGAVLYFTSGPDPEPPPPRPLRFVPDPLAEWEVRRYLEVFPELDRLLKEHASRLEDATGAVHDLLARRSMTPGDWDVLWRRVEDAVNRVRAVDDWPQGSERLRETIAQRERMLADAQGATKEQLTKDVAFLKEALERGPPPVHPKELELLRSFWNDLDRIVPTVGPAPPPR